MRRPYFARWLAVTVAAGLLIAGCSSAAETSDAGPSAASSEASAAADPSSSPGADSGDDAIALGGTDLPDNWPADLPGYPGATVLSVAVLDGGAIVNASWATDDSMDTAWQTVDTALRERDFVPLGDLGEESQFVQDETQTTDTYRNESFEVNVVVIAGERTTVLLNASRLT